MLQVYYNRTMERKIEKVDATKVTKQAQTQKQGIQQFMGAETTLLSRT